MKKKVVIVVVLTGFFLCSLAQNYQAIHGSPYAGSLGIYNNPATGVHSHFNWDLTLFAAQTKSSSNGFTATEPFPKLKNGTLFLSNGERQRYVHLSQDIHLLNGRLKLNKRKSFAFGFNTRNYTHVKSEAFKFIDTLSTFNSFLQLNRPSPSLGGNLINNSWAEIYASYSQIIRSTNNDQLSAGFTLRGIRGISGVYLHVNRMRFTEITQPGLAPKFVVTDPDVEYGYSGNYDKLEDNKSSQRNVNDFLRYTQGSLGLDLGVEYLVKTDYAPRYDDIEKFEYTWKIGVAILDLGRNFFKHGMYSRHITGVRADVSEQDLENKFSSPDDIKNFYDSLETIVQQLQSPGPNFYVSQPTRLVINVDKPLADNFAINGELSVNFFSTQNSRKLRTRELNLLTVTPRWETSLLGVYLPFQFNTQGQLWVGTALKAGPFLIGIHDWGWLFSEKKIFSGGAYLAFTVRNFFTSSDRTRRIKNLDCPPVN
jgi:hypothetical protein